MKKYTFIVTVTLLFGAYNVSAQKAENKEKLETEKQEVNPESKATLKPAKPVKTLSTDKRVIQKARIEKKKNTPIKKEGEK